VIFITMFVSFFLGDVLWGIERSQVLWLFSGFAGNMLVPFTNAGLFTIMRTQVPPRIQGRVFAARDTLQYFTIPIALFLGGFLADRVFEPFMQAVSPAQGFLSAIAGSGKGSGMALMFLLTGIVGCVSSLICLKNPRYRELD